MPRVDRKYVPESPSIAISGRCAAVDGKVVYSSASTEPTDLSTLGVFPAANALRFSETSDSARQKKETETFISPIMPQKPNVLLPCQGRFPSASLNSPQRTHRD